MTNDEKAEEWCVKNMDCCVREVFGDKEVPYFDEEERCVARSAFLDGLAEGEKIGKEKQWKATEKAQKKTSAKIAELEKENAVLQGKLADLESEYYELENFKDNEIEKLEAQIEQLSNDNHVLKTSFIMQQAQIEKMKCCENCEYGEEGGCCLNGDYVCDCKHQHWKLAEFLPNYGEYK